MLWKEVKPMDEKVLFIADWLRKICSFTELCERYTISRKTGYKWISRYNEGGVEDLREASRRPHQSPQQIPYAIRQAILELRTRGMMVLGPKKIFDASRIRMLLFQRNRSFSGGIYVLTPTDRRANRVASPKSKFPTSRSASKCFKRGDQAAH